MDDIFNNIEPPTGPVFGQETEAEPFYYISIVDGSMSVWNGRAFSEKDIPNPHVKIDQTEYLAMTAGDEKKKFSIKNGKLICEIDTTVPTEERIRQLKAQITELDYDINACEDGAVKAKTIEEYRAERLKLRNELRELLGKDALVLAAKA